MKKYDVTITETLQKVVPINANSLVQAEKIAEEKWNQSDYVLNADDFMEVGFDAKECVRSKEYERQKERILHENNQVRH